MTNHQIVDLFPKPLLVVDDVCLDHLDTFEYIIKDIIKTVGSKSTGFQYVDSTHQTFDNLYDVQQFQPLVKEIQNFSYIFLEQLGFSSDEISKMTLKNMWGNISTEGNYLFPHIHSNSIISGAFYVKASNTDYIQFYNDITDTSYLPATSTAYTKRINEQQCVSGRLLLFRSNLLHGTTVKKDTSEKIVVSFNVGFKNN